MRPLHHTCLRRTYHQGTKGISRPTHALVEFRRASKHDFQHFETQDAVSTCACESRNVHVNGSFHTKRQDAASSVCSVQFNQRSFSVWCETALKSSPDAIRDGLNLKAACEKRNFLSLHSFAFSGREIKPQTKGSQHQLWLCGFCLV